jgi:hypothetical protein
MSRSSEGLETLASHHERLLHAADLHLRQIGGQQDASDPTRWAELASQHERLANESDPLSGLASSSRRQLPPGSRLAVTAA